ncbi:hypothetical protein EVAR_5302_1 [Eumeta japonica]|uniref:Uncharacterized protein n=1 Tax=Eumeta variegata TaxID=151549 RepID=A0A4C1TM59_EUMVA|nr:hypothetical protein EVAR_5302_1 [Eumeta japonica]
MCHTARLQMPSQSVGQSRPGDRACCRISLANSRCARSLSFQGTLGCIASVFRGFMHNNSFQLTFLEALFMVASPSNQNRLRSSLITGELSNEFSALGKLSHSPRVSENAQSSIPAFAVGGSVTVGVGGWQPTTRTPVT